MGMDLSGIVFYGIPICGVEEDPPWENEYEEFECALADALGVKKPAEDTYHEFWRAQRKAVEATGVQHGFYGAGDYRGSFLYTRVIESDWGEPVDLERNDFSPSYEKDDTALKKVCELLGIEWQQPKWYLTALYW